MALGGWDSSFDAAFSWGWGMGRDWGWGAKGEKRLEDHEFGPCLVFFFFFVRSHVDDADVHIVAHSHILSFVVTFYYIISIIVIIITL